MPIEVTEAELLDALAVAGEWSDSSAESARVALEWMGWHGDGPMLLRQYDIQLFVWYQLPRKFLTDITHKREVADALARVLEHLGGIAASYASVCRSPETDSLLQAWEDESPDARAQFRRLMEQSGLEPPDTELLAWGSVMGLDEASVRNQIVSALESALESEALVPGVRDFRRLQAQVVDDGLRAPFEGGAGETRLEAVHAERLANWRARGIARGGERRESILAPIADLVDVPPPTLGAEAARVAVAPALWLLELGVDGIALTQTGAINRVTVRDAAERWSGWWDEGMHGPPHREADLVLLEELHQHLRDLRLLRRSGRRLRTTARGRALLGEPGELILAFANSLLKGDDFRAACTELAVALLLAGFEADWSKPLAEAIQPAIVEAGWNSNGEPPDSRDISWAISDFIRPATASGLIEVRKHRLLDPKPLAFTAAGRAAVIAALRGRALAPRRGPY